jgi:hypothetical protein
VSSKAVAEFWIGESDLWFTIFVDDNDNTLKIEVLSPLTVSVARAIDFMEVDRLIGAAKRELLAMAAAP